MQAGRIEQVRPPAEIYGRPATRFVADFFGRVNFLAGGETPHGAVGL
jgi:ABC-type Fe3+/spermidine/putrescine transport system ATPase subunit